MTKELAGHSTAVLVPVQFTAFILVPVWLTVGVLLMVRIPFSIIKSPQILSSVPTTKQNH